MSSNIDQTKLDASAAEEENSEILELTIEKKLKALYSLQQIDSQIDKIRIIRGELPLEVQDLEDEIAGLQIRIAKYKDDAKTLEKQISDKTNTIKDIKLLIKKYEEQQMNVRNNREYDALTKEIEFQNLEIELEEKRIREFTHELDTKNQLAKESRTVLKEREADLKSKKKLN